MNHGRDRIISHIENSLPLALGSLTGAEFSVALKGKTTDSQPLEDAFVWQQLLSIVDGPALFIAAGRDLWESMGRLTLEAAGIDTVTAEDCQSTWQEILSQTIAGIAAGVTSDVLREVTAAGGEEVKGSLSDVEWTDFVINQGFERTWTFRAAWSKKFTALYDPQPAEVAGPVARESTVSKTFDLLLEVALPVSVSFGKTSLQIREVLKLNTGSIVELNRFVNDPVEVVVNDCVIARGEVVVVDGNYGVRISQLASREDRLRTGMAEHHRIGVRP